MTFSIDVDPSADMEYFLEWFIESIDPLMIRVVHSSAREIRRLLFAFLFITNLFSLFFWGVEFDQLFLLSILLSISIYQPLIKFMPFFRKVSVNGKDFLYAYNPKHNQALMH